MDQHTDVSLTAAHDLGDFVDRQVGDDTQQHCLRHVGRQKPNQREGPIESADLIERASTRVVCTIQDGIGGEVLAARAALAACIDLPTAGDREQPAAERVAVAAEAVERSCHVDPHLRCQILGLGAAASTEVTQQEVLMGTPQGAQRFAITRPSAFDPLIHRDQYRSF
jgi:hypothetical protein